MKNAGVDVVRIVWASETEPLHVEPSPDVPGYVRVLTKTQESEDYWGKVDFTMPAEMALAFAAAVKACAEEQAPA
jgi:hypothetical protein